MKKFTLFDFVNDNSLQIGETSWIQDLPSDDNELERLLKPNEHVLVNWPVGERKTEKHLVKVVYMSDDPQELVEMMQKILRADEITKIQVLGKGKRKRIEMIFSESEESDLDKEQGKMMKHIKRKKSLQASAPANILSQLETSLINKQRETYSGSNFLYSESSSDDEEPLFQLSKVELCAKIKSLKRKLTDTMRENCRLRQSLVMLQVLPQAVTHFEELVGMAEALLKGGVTSSTSSLHSHALWKASNNPLADSYAAMHSNSSSPVTLNVEDEEQQTEKQFKIEKWQIALCNKSKPQKFINDLMQALYTHEYMATHSLTGAKSSSSKDKAAKPAMNQNEVQEIIVVQQLLLRASSLRLFLPAHQISRMMIHQLLMHNFPKATAVRLLHLPPRKVSRSASNPLLLRWSLISPAAHQRPLPTRAADRISGIQTRTNRRYFIPVQILNRD
ncbi:BEN domain-containing protein 6 isoform 2-T5 [Theristicus caerulescens]